MDEAARADESARADEVARAFVPGHATGFFAVHRDADPTRTGSTGAGVALTDGVTVEVEYARETAVRIDGEPAEVAAVERVLSALSVTATVRVETEIPVGAGFGTSGAMALGTALAANELFAGRLSENELATIAHGAEVQAGTGLGDVIAQARGGVPLRLEPGGPHHCVIDAIPARRRIEYVSFGERETGEIIDGDTDRIDRAGEEARSLVVSKPTLEQFMYASRRFAREAELLTDDVREAIDAVGEAGGEAAMAMLGNTVFALDRGLTEAGYDPQVCEIHACGATLLD